jgi:hypothetical protein
MSIAPLVVTAVVVEGRSKSEVARCYGVSRRWVITLVQRFLAEASPRWSRAQDARGAARAGLMAPSKTRSWRSASTSWSAAMTPGRTRSRSIWSVGSAPLRHHRRSGVCSPGGGS